MLEQPPKFVLLMLAAGLSRRMGGPNKLLQPYRGKPLLAHALENSREIDFSDRIVVTGRDSAKIEALAARFDFRCVYNPRFAEGLGASIAAGARALRPDAGAVFIALGDMPEIGPDIYRALAAQFRHGSIVSPVFRGAAGHPVLFCASYAPEISALSGDEGARSVLRRHEACLVRVETRHSGIIRDVDTSEDFDVSPS